MKLSHNRGATQDGQNNTLEGINRRITEVEERRNDCHVTKYRKKNEKKKEKKTAQETTGATLKVQIFILYGSQKCKKKELRKYLKR